MTEGDKAAEIAAMVTERNALRREIACIENKLDRIMRALSEVSGVLGGSGKLHVVQGDGISIGLDGATLPPIEVIRETQNRLVAAKARVAVLDQRIDGV